MAVEIDRSGPERWRYRCPRGHINWEQHGDTITCVSCPRGWVPGSVSYDSIFDYKTGEEIDVEEVRVA